jgi:hypothetical protein
MTGMEWIAAGMGALLLVTALVFAVALTKH